MNPWSRTSELHIAPTCLLCRYCSVLQSAHYCMTWRSSTCNKVHTECQEFAWCLAVFALSFLQLLSLWCFIVSHLSLSLAVVLIYWNFQYFGLVLSCICWRAIDRRWKPHSDGWHACVILGTSIFLWIWGIEGTFWHCLPSTKNVSLILVEVIPLRYSTQMWPLQSNTKSNCVMAVYTVCMLMLLSGFVRIVTIMILPHFISNWTILIF